MSLAMRPNEVNTEVQYDCTVAAGNEPEAHPPDAEWQADADPHKEVVTYAVRHIDRLEK